MNNKKEEKTPSCSPELQNRVLLFTAVLAIILNVVAIILCAPHLSNYAQDKKLSSVKTNQPAGYLACVLCTTLTTTPQISLIHPKVRKLSIVTGKEKKKWCCAKTSQELSVLLALVLNASSRVRKQEPLPTYDPTNFTFSSHSVQKRLRPSNLRLLKYFDVSLYDEYGTNPLIFSTQKLDPLVEHNQRINATATDNLVINASGYYYVYSNIIFHPGTIRPCRDFKKQTWDHNVMLTRDRDRFASGIILQSSHSCCDNCSREIATSFTGGVFYLEENDKLHVEVSGYGLVSYRKEGSYFGLYRLGEEAGQGFN